MRPTSSNISKRERAHLPAKPEFGFTGVIVGILVGWLSGAGVEIAMGKPKMLIMAGTTFAAVFVGTTVEGVRFWLRMRHYRAARKP